MWYILEQLLYDNSIEEEYWRKMRQKLSSNSAIIVGLVAAIGGFLYGYDTGLINDIMEMQYVMSKFPSNHMSFSTHERALITAILSLGTLSGALVAPLLSDNFGRKFSIILSAAFIFNLGNILQTASSTVALLCIGRAISGVGIGMLSAVVPLYQAEASPKWVRGSVVFTYQWAITWGLMIASAICQGTRKVPNSVSYRVPIGLQFLWATGLSLGMFFLPESPRYYVQKNNIEKALQSLSKLRRLPTSDPDLIEELVEIKANYDYELSFGKTTVLDCFRNGGGRHKQVLRMITGIGVQAFQQCSGINFIFYYGTNFFASAGMSNYYMMSFVTYCVNTVFTIPGIILIDTIGRRKLLVGGGVGMSTSNFIIAIVGECVSSSYISSTICISFSCVFIAFFASSWGGCAWALASDIYGISIRQKAMSITTATNWIMNFIFAYITPYLIDTGNHTASLGTKIFFIWGGLNTLGTIFVYFTVYETKGLKLEEVDYMYLHCDGARSSSKFKSTKIDYKNYDNSPPSDSSINEKNHEDDHSNSLEQDHSKEASNYLSSLSQETPDQVPGDINNHEITIVPYNNVLSPSISDNSMTSTDCGHFKHQGPEHGSEDYQKYLNSLQDVAPPHRDEEQSGSSIGHSKLGFSEPNNLNINTGVTLAPILHQPPDFDSDSESNDSRSTT